MIPGLDVSDKMTFELVYPKTDERNYIVYVVYTVHIPQSWADLTNSPSTSGLCTSLPDKWVESRKSLPHLFTIDHNIHTYMFLFNISLWLELFFYQFFKEKEGIMLPILVVLGRGAMFFNYIKDSHFLFG